MGVICRRVGRDRRTSRKVKRSDLDLMFLLYAVVLSP